MDVAGNVTVYGWIRRSSDGGQHLPPESPRKRIDNATCACPRSPARDEALFLFMEMNVHVLGDSIRAVYAEVGA